MVPQISSMCAMAVGAWTNECFGNLKPSRTQSSVTTSLVMLTEICNRRISVYMDCSNGRGGEDRGVHVWLPGSKILLNGF